MFSNAQIAEALSTVLEINEDNTPRVAFFGYAGHTLGLQIDIYPLGWDKDDKRKDYHLLFTDYADMDCCEGKTYRGKRNTQIEHYKDFQQMLDAIREAGL